MKHKTVLLNETVDLLQYKEGGVYVDCTLGGGGHSLEILGRVSNATLICFDLDKNAIENFSIKLGEVGFDELEIENNMRKFAKDKVNISLVNENFRNLGDVLRTLKIEKVDGIIADLGWASNQLDDGVEGLSFENGGDDLDMRFDNSLGVKASDLLLGLGVKELSRMFEWYADFLPFESRTLAKEIVRIREFKQIKKNRDLGKIVDKLNSQLGNRAQKNPIQTKARVFQALRIAVNQEYENLKELLETSLKNMNESGNFSVITFHSGEARIVEEFFVALEKQNKGKFSTKNGAFKYIVPSREEIKINRHSRSAKLYGFKLK